MKYAMEARYRGLYATQATIAKTWAINRARNSVSYGKLFLSPCCPPDNVLTDPPITPTLERNRLYAHCRRAPDAAAMA